MSITSDDVFNARDLEIAQVASRFIAPPPFQRLLSQSHCVLEGPRGSGKTTLLRMLTAEAYAMWDGKSSAPPLEFIGVFVPADIRWAKQLALRLDCIQDILAKDIIQKSLFSVALNLSFVNAVERSGSLFQKFGTAHPSLFFELRRQDEARLSAALAETWELTLNIDSFASLRVALGRRHRELSQASLRLATGTELSAFIAEAPYCGTTWLDGAVAAIETTNEILGRPEQRWAILLDELEIVPAQLLESIVEALRSTMNLIRFKLALSPSGSDLVRSDAPGASSAQEDYKSVRLWYERKGDARAFGTRLFSESLARLQQVAPSEINLPHIFGVSLQDPTIPEELDSLDEHQSAPIESSSALQRARISAFRALAARDESFAAFLARNNIDPENPSYRDSKEGLLVRKVTQIVLHRAREVSRFSTSIGHSRRKGGQRSETLYAGIPNLVDLTEGNPRWILTLVEGLLAENAKRPGFGLRSRTIQKRAIQDYVGQLTAKLMVYPTKVANQRARWTPLKFVEVLGGSIASALFDGEFSSDPAMSFEIDQRALDEYGGYIRTAIDMGALVIMEAGATAPLSGASEGHSLLGARVRLTYRLAPVFRIPLLATKTQKMSSAIKSGELLQGFQGLAPLGLQFKVAEVDLPPPPDPIQGRLI